MLLIMQYVVGSRRLFATCPIKGQKLRGVSWKVRPLITYSLTSKVPWKSVYFDVHRLIGLYLLKLCSCVVWLFLHVYMYKFSGCLCILGFCWCVHIAGPKRGRLFHLIEGQYLYEHSYRQLSLPSLDSTQAATVYSSNHSVIVYFSIVLTALWLDCAKTAEWLL